MKRNGVTYAQLVEKLAAIEVDDKEVNVRKADLLRIHVVLGVTALTLTLVRILWWWPADQRPRVVAGQPRWQATAALAVHGLLYVAILVVGASGAAMLVLSGALPIIFGFSVLPLPDVTEYAPRLVHGLVARLMIVLLIGHVSAALWHQFIRRDRLLARMGIGA